MAIAKSIARTDEPRRQYVYAYGCAAPVEGLSYAMREHERCTIFWDQLVKIDVEYRCREVKQAQIDDPELKAIGDEIDALTKYLLEMPDDKAVRQKRRTLYPRQRERLNIWRKTHREWLKELNRWRIEEVSAARRAVTIDSNDPIYWGNSNRVLRSYETGRQVAAYKGRLLRLHDSDRDDGVLAIQIQKTKTGLGAAPHELFDGTFSDLQISPPDSRHNARLSMRIDAAGNQITLPIWIHRPLPPMARAKAAQLVWRKRGDRLSWQLSITVTVPAEPLQEAVGVAPHVEFDWSGQSELEVMRIGDRCWRLPEHWMRRMDRLEAQQAELHCMLEAALARWADEPNIHALLALRFWQDRIQQMALARERLPEEAIQWWVKARRLWLTIPGTRRHVLGHRREMYRLWAREVSQRYVSIKLSDLNIARIAHEERGTEGNSARHRAAVHSLRQELIHQMTKANLPVYDASGHVMNAPKGEKSTAWARRKAGKTAALATGLVSD